MTERNQRKTRVGVVVSDKALKTVVVSVGRQFIHPTYNKIIRTGKKYNAHDEKNESHVGDQVMIMETRPLSKTKRWRVIEILKKAK
jgi:small subunit ribosomal protein S17